MHADHQDVHVVVAARSAVLLFLKLAKGDLLDGLPCVLNIDRGAEGLGARGTDPLMHFVPAPLAGSQHDVSAATSKGQIHPPIQHFRRKRSGMIAIVILEVVDAPLSELLRVLKFMLKAARIPGTGVQTATGVDAKLESAGMYIVRDRLYSIREFDGIRDQSSLLISAFLAPAVVHDDILIARLRQSLVDNGVGRGADQIFAHLIVKCVP